MAIATAHYGGSQTNQEVISAVENKIILVVRLVVAANSFGNYKFMSDPGGPGAQDLTPLLYIASKRLDDLRLGRRHGLATARGKALGFTSDFSSPPSDHSIMVWYELVD